jgi:hypothetical protein
VPIDADLETVIKDANANLVAGTAEIKQLIGKDIPIWVNFDLLGFRMSAAGKQHETKEVVRWLSVNALTLVLSTETGLGELVADPFSREIVLKYPRELEIRLYM